MLKNIKNIKVFEETAVKINEKKIIENSFRKKVLKLHDKVLKKTLKRGINFVRLAEKAGKFSVAMLFKNQFRDVFIHFKFHNSNKLAIEPYQISISQFSKFFSIFLFIQSKKQNIHTNFTNNVVKTRRIRNKLMFNCQKNEKISSFFFIINNDCNFLCSKNC